MSRVKRGVTSHAKHKKVYKAAKGFSGRRKNTIRAAKAALADIARPEARRDPERVKALIDTCFDSADYREGRRAFLEKRKPQFRGE